MTLDGDEDLEDLAYFESDAEAVLSTEATFGRYLPLAYKAWDHLSTDAGVAELCFSGVGGWYLAGARSAEESGHAVAEGAVFEASLDYMGSYETRKKWITYGGALPHKVHLTILSERTPPSPPGTAARATSRRHRSRRARARCWASGRASWRGWWRRPTRTGRWPRRGGARRSARRSR
jgi:hypothetical protein